MPNMQISYAQLDTGGNETLSPTEAAEYIQDEIQDLIGKYNIKDPKVNIRMYTEGSSHDPVQKVEVKFTSSNVNIRKAAHSRTIKKAIDRAMVDIETQMKRQNEKKIAKARHLRTANKRAMEAQAQDIV